MRPTFDKRSGFTIVELIVGIGIMSAITVGLLALIVNLVGLGSRSIETTKQVNEVQSALNTIQNDLRLTSKFLATVSGDLNRSNAAWSHNGGSAGNRTLLLQARSTYLSSNAEGRLPLYRISAPAYGLSDYCLSTSSDFTYLGIPMTGSPEYHTVIYYLHNATLYRRTVAQPVTFPLTIAQCTANIPARTCVDPASAPAANKCTQKDVALAQNVTEFDIIYYSRPTDQTANAAALQSGATQSILDSATSIQVKIKTNKDVGGRNNEFASQVRATRGSAL